MILNHADIVKAAADLDASNATFTWLDNTPPIEQADVHLNLVDADILEIHLTSGRQRVDNHDADLAIKDSEMRITGLSLPDQTAKIHAQVDGRLAAHSRYSPNPLALAFRASDRPESAAGDVSVGLDLQFPLENKLRIVCQRNLGRCAQRSGVPGRPSINGTALNVRRSIEAHRSTPLPNTS